MAKKIPCARSVVSEVLAGKASVRSKLTRKVAVRWARKIGRPVDEVFPEYRGAA